MCTFSCSISNNCCLYAVFLVPICYLKNSLRHNANVEFIMSSFLCYFQILDITHQRVDLNWFFFSENNLKACKREYQLWTLSSFLCWNNFILAVRSTVHTHVVLTTTLQHCHAHCHTHAHTHTHTHHSLNYFMRQNVFFKFNTA